MVYVIFVDHPPQKKKKKKKKTLQVGTKRSSSVFGKIWQLSKFGKILKISAFAFFFERSFFILLEIIKQRKKIIEHHFVWVVASN